MSFDTRIEEKEEEKVCNNDLLNFELASFWKLKITIVPVLPGELGATECKYGQRKLVPITERKPLRNRKNNLESDEHLEPEENCMIPGCGLLSLH